MTWRLKVQGVVFTILVLAALALVAGAAWVEAFDGFTDSLF